MGKHKDPEYREYVAKLIVEEGRVATELAYELELPYSTIRKWAASYREKIESETNPAEYVTPKELESLRKQHENQVQQLKEENEILKKAMHIFTKNQK